MCEKQTYKMKRLQKEIAYAAIFPWFLSQLSGFHPFLTYTPSSFSYKLLFCFGFEIRK